MYKKGLGGSGVVWLVGGGGKVEHLAQRHANRDGKSTTLGRKKVCPLVDATPFLS